jgi:superfamily II DNA helicase RecQ
MKNNKDIGEVVKDQLESYELTPGDHVWKGIQRDLDRKKKRKVLAFWLFGGGLLVGLLGGFWVNYLTNDCDETTLETVVTINPTLDRDKESYNSNSNESVRLHETTDSNDKDLDNDKLTENRESSNSVVSTGSKGSNLKLKQSKSTTQNSNKNLSYYDFMKDNSTDSGTSSATQKSDYELLNSSSLVDMIELSELEEISDSLVEKKKLREKKEKEKSDNEEEKNQKNKKVGHWIYAYYAPTTLGKVSDREFLNPNFAQTSQHQQITSSFGAYYKLKIDKVTIKAGLAFINLSYLYDMEDFNTHPAAYQSISLNSNITPNQINDVIDNHENPEIKHNLSYYEIPLEIGIEFFRRNKFSTDAIMSFSTLIKRKDELILSSSQFSNTNIGESENFRKSEFYLGIGLGFRYQLSERFNLNVNPILKTNSLTVFSDSPYPKAYIFQVQLGVSYNLGF